jgi:hypothetical protein
LADHVVTLTGEAAEQQGAFRGVVDGHGIRLGDSRQPAAPDAKQQLVDRRHRQQEQNQPRQSKCDGDSHVCTLARVVPETRAIACPTPHIACVRGHE